MDGARRAGLAIVNRTFRKAICRLPEQSAAYRPAPIAATGYRVFARDHNDKLLMDRVAVRSTLMGENTGTSRAVRNQENALASECRVPLGRVAGYPNR